MQDFSEQLEVIVQISAAVFSPLKVIMFECALKDAWPLFTEIHFGSGGSTWLCALWAPCELLQQMHLKSKFYKSFLLPLEAETGGLPPGVRLMTVMATESRFTESVAERRDAKISL